MNLKNYIYSKPILETQRLILRELIPEDIPALKEWTGNIKLYDY